MNTRIEISADGSTLGESWRIDRLHSFLGAMAVLCEMSVVELDERIGLKALHDHKGFLSTKWTDFAEAAKYVGIVGQAWEAVGEISDAVDFHVQIHGNEVVFESTGNRLTNIKPMGIISFVW